MNRTIATSIFVLSVAAGAFVRPLGAQESRTADADFIDQSGIDSWCITLARRNPTAALDATGAWQDHGGGDAAVDCLILALIGLKKFDDAAERLERRAADGTSHPVMIRLQMLAQSGRLWLIAGDARRAHAAQTRALELSPQAVPVLIDRSISSQLMARYWDALDDLYLALDLDPQNVEAMIFRADTYRKLGTLDLARDDLERALATQPTHPDGLLERGEIRRLQGDAAGAQDDWQRLLWLSPDSAAAADARVRLRELDATALRRSSVGPQQAERD